MHQYNQSEYYKFALKISGINRGGKLISENLIYINPSTNHKQTIPYRIKVHKLCASFSCVKEGRKIPERHSNSLIENELKSPWKTQHKKLETQQFG